MAEDLKGIVWIGSSKRDLGEFPREVQREVGHALLEAQRGKRHVSVKMLRGFGGGNTVEIVEDHDGDTYRCVYTTRFAGRVYVLHSFQKKSVKGAKTPQPDIDRIKSRLADAKDIHQATIRAATLASKKKQKEQGDGEG